MARRRICPCPRASTGLFLCVHYTLLELFDLLVQIMTFSIIVGLALDCKLFSFVSLSHHSSVRQMMCFCFRVFSSFVVAASPTGLLLCLLIRSLLFRCVAQ